MRVNEIMNRVDHTLLAQTATWEEIRELCDDGLKYNTASVCIPSSFVKRAANYLQGRLPVCTVIGFPNGYQPAEIKVAEAKMALQDGAEEIDMVISIGDVKEGNYDKVREEIQSVKKACGHHILKVIIETCLLHKEEKIEMCRVVSESGADFIKTSTGFSTAGATFEDVRLLRKYVGQQVKVKAAGGIASFADAEEFIRLGADRLGTSRLIKILKEQETDQKDLEEQQRKTVIRRAMEARKNSYSPYSHFAVGACLQTENGKLFSGCNIENSSYPATNCAERTAFFEAAAAGERDFSRIAIVGGEENKDLIWCPPCGICRQVMQEFCDPDTFEIILALSEQEYKTYTLKELFPFGFTL